MPHTLSAIQKKSKAEGWERRKVGGVKGRAYEYHIDSLPKECLPALFKKLGKVLVDNKVLDLPKPPVETYSKESFWYKWEQGGEKAQAKAYKRLELVKAWHALVKAGAQKVESYLAIAKEYNVGRNTVLRAVQATAGIHEDDWLAALIPTHNISNKHLGRRRRADIPEEAWELFKADYLRPEKPSYAACYYRLEALAPQKGWVLPRKNCFRQRLLATVSAEAITLHREGEHALMMMYPPQQRTVFDIEAASWINGDGYKHNVFVKWPNGEIRRPVTWFWQDVRTRKITSYRTDISENSDTIRLSLLDTIERYGIPQDVTIDNTRAAANKWLTGGVANRYRFKVKADDPVGLIPTLGIKLHWTTVILGKGHGQAKPIERAFGNGGLEEFVDKHPTLAGAYTGPNPSAKPDNYGETAIPLAQFLEILEQGVQMYNARANRQTELCGGVMSFDEVFERDYARATVRTATNEQKRMFLLSAETAKVSKQGMFTLKAGGKIANQENRYHCDELYQYIGKKLIIRFDPQNLHGTVHCYSLHGTYIGEAECMHKAGFGDQAASREQHRTRQQFTKAKKAQAAAEKKLTTAELAEQMRQLEIDDEQLPPPAASALVTIQRGNTLARAETQPQPIEQNDEAAFASRVALMMAEKRKNEI
ncbi:Mu transposase C-terminal domain-containing protein [Agarivorans sp. B2Z047]|nr:Mu transposase C-terminal domain-containing protein [Agarivorans sp. B2Z047]